MMPPTPGKSDMITLNIFSKFGDRLFVTALLAEALAGSNAILLSPVSQAQIINFLSSHIVKYHFH